VDRSLEPSDRPVEYRKFRGRECLVPPGGFVLCRSVERFRIPHNVVGLGFGKSTYARMGIFVNVTPLEPGWEGYLTLAVNNLSGVPFKLVAGEGLCQILFFVGEKPNTTYDEGGKYHKQEEILGAIG
jgi:dCTP deaminase